MLNCLIENTVGISATLNGRYTITQFNDSTFTQFNSSTTKKMRGILLNTDYDFEIESNRFQLGESSAQTAEMILRANPGEFKEVPVIGGGVEVMTCGSVDPFWKGKMKAQLKEMKVDVKEITINSDGIQLIIND